MKTTLTPWHTQPAYDASGRELVQINGSNPFDNKLPHGGNFVASFAERGRANADLIVKAVNSLPAHLAAVEALKICQVRLFMIAGRCDEYIIAEKALADLPV